MKRVLSMVMVLMAAPEAAQAQSFGGNSQVPPLVSGAADPRHEIGLNLGFWSLDKRGGLFGVRWSRKIQGPVAVEASFDKQMGDSPGTQYGLFIVSARLLERPPSRPVRYFATAGVARGYGLAYGWSPVVGAGVQSNSDEPVFIRVEVQVFPRAPKTTAERGRLLLGMTIAF